jgi:hypothetical protein
MTILSLFDRKFTLPAAIFSCSHPITRPPMSGMNQARADVCFGHGRLKVLKREKMKQLLSTSDVEIDICWAVPCAAVLRQCSPSSILVAA